MGGGCPARQKQSQFSSPSHLCCNCRGTEHGRLLGAPDVCWGRCPNSLCGGHSHPHTRILGRCGGAPSAQFAAQTVSRCGSKAAGWPDLDMTWGPRFTKQATAQSADPTPASLHPTLPPQIPVFRPPGPKMALKLLKIAPACAKKTALETSSKPVSLPPSGSPPPRHRTLPTRQC